MTAATAVCSTNAIFYQHSTVSTRQQFTSTLRRSTLTTLSPSPALPSTHVQEIESSNNIESDENNNPHAQTKANDDIHLDDVLYIINDEDNNIDDDGVNNDLLCTDGEENTNTVPSDPLIDQEQFLLMVGLRAKNQQRIVKTQTLKSLTKRFACPVCLLPLPKHGKRVQQALYIRLPNLKFLKNTKDIEKFCSTDDNAKAQSLLPRSLSHSRASRSVIRRRSKPQKLTKTALVNLTSDASDIDGVRCSMNEDVQSILQCHVALDRLEQSSIDQLMQTSPEKNDNIISTVTTAKQSSQEASQKMTTKRMTVKRKSTSARVQKSKRFKSSIDDQKLTSNNDDDTDASSSMYQRIYLKCFVCPKQTYIDAQAVNSDVLNSHWLAHKGKLLLNIYDSEIDSILTRVVEFFNLPKQHTLEGKIKTVFILNSKEIRRTPVNNSSSSDACIVID